jgi:hypothetical protein
MQMQFFSDALGVDEYERPAAVTICEWTSWGFALCDQRCPALRRLVTIVAYHISARQQLIQFP